MQHGAGDRVAWTGLSRPVRRPIRDALAPYRFATCAPETCVPEHLKPEHLKPEYLKPDRPMMPVSAAWHQKKRSNQDNASAGDSSAM
jgi:hypothetical protein